MVKKQKTEVVKSESNIATLVGYNEYLKELKEKIRNTQLKAAIAVLKN